MLAALKLVGLLVIFLGILTAFGDLMGWFVDREKAHIVDLVWNSEGGIPKDTPGFEKFMQAFPPPGAVDPSRVTHIVKSKIRMGPVVMDGTVGYLTDDQLRTDPVATFGEILQWAGDTVYEWVSWIIAAVGALILLVIEIYERVFNGKVQASAGGS